MVRVEVARRAAASLNDAAVTRIILATVRQAQQRSSPSQKRGSERGSGGSISVAFVGPKRMRELNRTYHGEDRVTDVLAFRSTEERRTKERRTRRSRIASSPFLRSSVLTFDLGELIVCPPYVRQQAKRSGEPVRRALARVLIHGTLHLLGYDHANPQDAARMFALQEQILGTAV